MVRPIVITVHYESPELKPTVFLSEGVTDEVIDEIIKKFCAVPVDN
jgi:hypothetical protein